MAGLTAVGTLSYNGYTFDGASTVTARSTFVKDDAGRTVIGHEISLTVTATITAGGNATDASLLNIRALLSKQGAELKFINRGFGTDIWVNRIGGGGLRDMRWGPIPEILEWESIGSSQACEIVWTVKTFIPVCDTYGQHVTKGLMALNYEASFQISRGFTTRTISGYLEIAQTRTPGFGPAGGRGVPDCADLYRDLVRADAPLGFTREHSYDTSANKSRLDFTITDKEIESKNPWPAGVANISAKHRANWSRGGQGAARIRNTISADIELTPGVPATQAWLIFGSILSQRVIGSAYAAGMVPFLQDVSAEEDIFGYSSSFSASYWVLGNPADFLQKSGLWRPLTGTDWTTWRTSLKGTMFANRGRAGLVLSPANDAIVDICGAQPLDESSVVNGTGRGNVPGQPVFRNKTPPANQSYVKYKMATATYADRDTVRQGIMQTPDAPTGSDSPFNTNGPTFGNPPSSSPGQSTNPPDVLQQGSRSSNQITLAGYAERAGWPIPKPLMTTVAGRPVVESSAAFVQETMGMYFGVPVYRAAWQITYDLDSSPGTVLPPGNPEQGTQTR